MTELKCPKCGNKPLVNLLPEHDVSRETVWKCSECNKFIVVDPNGRIKEVSKES